jgi:hypothetical protein
MGRGFLGVSVANSTVEDMQIATKRVNFFIWSDLRDLPTERLPAKVYYIAYSYKEPT